MGLDALVRDRSRRFPLGLLAGAAVVMSLVSFAVSSYSGGLPGGASGSGIIANQKYTLPCLRAVLVGMHTSPTSFKRVQGTWSGRREIMTIEISIDTDGVFQWVSTFGDARGEGAGHIRSIGSHYLIELPFIQQQPMEMRVANDRKTLTLIGQGDTVLVLHQGALGQEEQ